MEPLRPCLMLAASAALFGCAETVTIPQQDSTPPDVKLTAIATGEDRGTVESGGSAATAYQLVREQSALLASAQDDGGVKRLEIEAVSGGNLSFTGQPNTRTVTKTGSRDTPKDRLLIGAGPVFAEDTGQLLVRAVAEDFHGNVARTALLTIDEVQPATVTLSANPNPVVRGNHSDLSWRITGGNFKSAELRAGSSQVIRNNAGASGSERVNPSSDTTYTLTATTHVDQPTTPGDQVRLQVAPPPMPQVSVSAQRSSVTAGDTVRFTYSGQDVDQISIPKLNVGPTASLTGATSKTLNADFTATAEGLVNGQVAATDSVNVTVQVPATIDLRKHSTKPGQPGHVCSPTQSSIQLSTQEVTRPFGTYDTVDQVKVDGFDVNNANVTIWHYPPTGSMSKTTIGAQATGSTGNTTTHFSGEDTGGRWCFNLNSSFEQPGVDSLPVTFTLSN